MTEVKVRDYERGRDTLVISYSARNSLNPAGPLDPSPYWLLFQQENDCFSDKITYL